MHSTSVAGGEGGGILLKNCSNMKMNGESESSPIQATTATVVNQSKPSTSQSEPRNRSLRRGRRGTRLKEIPISRCAREKIEIQFDSHWNHIGPNRSRYRSYVGVLARSKLAS